MKVLSWQINAHQVWWETKHGNIELTVLIVWLKNTEPKWFWLIRINPDGKENDLIYISQYKRTKTL